MYLHISDRTGQVQRPLRELKGFEKVALMPGETKTVTMALDARSFSYYSVKLHDWYAHSGEYRITVAASSQDIRLEKTIHYHSERALPIHITPNTTVGDLCENAKTREIGMELRGRLMQFLFPGSSKPEDAAAVSMADSLPLRGAVGFGDMSQEELDEIISKYSG